MNIVVCVKQVPDTWAERTLRPEDSRLDRASVDGVINELDEYAIEEGLRLAEAHGGEVTILTMGPDKASESIRKALSMGADKAVHVLDDGLAGSDALQTSAALAAVLGRIGFDLVILGAESTDARMGVMAAMLAERLGVPQVSLASKVEVDGTALRIHRQQDYGYDKVEAEPARRDQRRGEDQRAAVPLVQGHHGGQEEAGGDAHPGRRRASTRARSAWPARPPKWSASPSARRGRRARSSRTKATAGPRRLSSWPRRSSSEPQAR